MADWTKSGHVHFMNPDGSVKTYASTSANPINLNTIEPPKTTPSYVIHYNNLAAMGRKMCMACTRTALEDDHLCIHCRYSR